MARITLAAFILALFGGLTYWMAAPMLARASTPTQYTEWSTAECPQDLPPGHCCQVADDFESGGARYRWGPCNPSATNPTPGPRVQEETTPPPIAPEPTPTPEPTPVRSPPTLTIRGAPAEGGTAAAGSTYVVEISASGASNVVCAITVTTANASSSTHTEGCQAAAGGTATLTIVNSSPGATITLDATAVEARGEHNRQIITWTVSTSTPTVVDFRGVYTIENGQVRAGRITLLAACRKARGCTAGTWQISRARPGCKINARISRCSTGPTIASGRIAATADGSTRTLAGRSRVNLTGRTRVVIRITSSGNVVRDYAATITRRGGERMSPVTSK